MHPLIISPSGKSRGGAEEAMLQYVAWRSGRGQQTHVVVLEPGDLGDVLRQRGAAVTEFSAGQLRQVGRFARTVKLIAGIARRERPDLILGWMTKAQIYGGPAGRLAGVPSMYFQMGLPDGGSVDMLSRRCGACGAVGCSEFVAREQGQVVRHPVLPVPLAADLSRFEAAAHLSTAECKRQLGFDPEQPLVGIVGRLQRWKGMHHYLDAMGLVLERRPDVQGVIVGGPHDSEPEYPEQLQRQAQELDIADRVRFAGVQKNVPHWMQAMDVVIHASEREPFGIVVVEAMSLGKPVIAAIPGGPEEIITPEANGLLVPWADKDGLAGAILRYLEDPDLARRCGQAAALRAREFSPEAFSLRLENCLREMLPGAGGARTA